MTTQQLQCLLAFHGYDTGGIDGIQGGKTTQALRAFQERRGLPVTGQADAQTRQTLRRSIAEAPASFWDQIPNFTRQEFACKCGCGFPAEPKEAMVRIAQAARDHFGAPATVVSGLRCKAHNARVGGVANSQHMAGEACDLAVQGVSAQRLLAFLQGYPGVRYAYKINETNVHFDIERGGN